MVRSRMPNSSMRLRHQPMDGAVLAAGAEMGLDILEALRACENLFHGYTFLICWKSSSGVGSEPAPGGRP